MLLHLNSITLQTTGGYSSDLNGNVEIFNKTLKRGAGVLLANAGLELPYWCYATVHYCNVHNFLSYNHDKTKRAFEAWYGRRPIWKDSRIFGCDIYVVNESGSKNDLKNATCHKFLGWGASTQMVHYLDSHSNRIKRARHVYFDDFSSSTPIEKLSPGGILLRFENAPPQIDAVPEVSKIQDTNRLVLNVQAPCPSPILDHKNTTLDDKNVRVSAHSLSFDSEVLNFHLNPDPSPFPEDATHSYKVDISNSKTRPFGLFIQYDIHFGIPLVKEILPTSPWYISLPSKFRRNIWILGLDNTEPIAPSAAYDTLEHCV